MMLSCLYVFLICIQMCMIVDGAAVAPSGKVQYVFNVPTELQGGNQHALQAAIANLQEQFTILSKRLQVIESNGTANIGSVTATGWGVHYIHWGKEKCNDQATLIYKGLMAKTYSDNTGGGIDYQCLPFDPEYTKDAVSNSQGLSKIQGVEIWSQNVEGVHSSSENHHEVSCSVCEATMKHQVLMIPAKLSCPKNWHKQYEGYLMAEQHNHNSPSTFACIDKDVEYVDGGLGNQRSAYLLPVETDCASLPCPKYEEGKELSCVVCTK